MSEKKYEFVPQKLNFLGRESSTPEEMEWQRREDLRRACVENPHIAPLGSRAAENTTHVGNLQTQGCWLCDENVSPYAAARSLWPYEEKDKRCPTCFVRLKYTVPFTAWPRPWYWSRPDDMTLREVYDTLRRHGTIWLNQMAGNPPDWEPQR